MRLKGKVAIVTGAGQGLGQSIALRLAQEGAEIAAIDIRWDAAKQTAEEISKLGRRAIALKVDVSEVNQIRPMVERVLEGFGKIDVLVNNAGVIQTKPMLDLTEADWDWVVGVNMKGLFFCLQAVASVMIERKGGTIINISSVAARGGRPLQAHYAASKAAVLSITRSAALALAPYVTVNAICPGVIETPMWRRIVQDRSSLTNVPGGETAEQILARIPLRRTSTPEEIAAVVAFLASPEASYITGQAINVCGGLEMD